MRLRGVPHLRQVKGMGPLHWPSPGPYCPTCGRASGGNPSWPTPSGSASSRGRRLALLPPRRRVLSPSTRWPTGRSTVASPETVHRNQQLRPPPFRPAAPSSGPCSSQRLQTLFLTLMQTLFSRSWFWLPSSVTIKCKLQVPTELRVLFFIFI